MKTLFKNLILLISCFFIFSCAKDKGNYDLTTINEINIERLSDQSLIELSFGDTLNFAPKFAQENIQNGAYKYRWYLIPGSQAPVIELSDKISLKAAMNYPVGAYTLYLTITDANTKISSTVSQAMRLVTKFSSGLVVLEEQAKGGNISHILLDGKVERDLYSKGNNGEYLATPIGKLYGLFLSTGDAIQKPISLFVSEPGRNTIEVNPDSYEKIGLFSKRLANPPSETIELTSLLGYSSGTSIAATVNKRFQFSALATTEPLFLGALTGDYEVSPWIVSSTSASNIANRINFICFDQKNGRFLWYSSFTSGALNTFTKTTDPVVFDLNNIKKENIFGGFSNNIANYNYLMKDPDGQAHCYILNPVGTQKAAIGYFKIPYSDELSKAKLFAASTDIPVIYFAYENKIFLYDHSANLIKLAYTFPANQTVTDITFAISRIPTSATKNRVYRTLDKFYVATYSGSEGIVNEFAISNTGTLADPIKTYKGFGKIHSMFYKEKR